MVCPTCGALPQSPWPSKWFEGEPGLEGAVEITEMGDAESRWLLPGGGVAFNVTPYRVKRLWLVCANGHEIELSKHHYEHESRAHTYTLL